MPAFELFIWNVIWMSWNAALALLPFLLAILLFRPHHKHRGLIWAFGFILFILFLPNSPYLLTDVIHIPTDISKVDHRISHLAITWQYFILMALGYYLFCKSYNMFEDFFLKKRNLHGRLWIRVIIFGVVSVGVYLGRFPRLNSWDAFVQPLNLLKMFRDLINPMPVGFIMLFTLLLLISYYCWEWFHSQKLLYKHKKKK